MAAFDEHVLQIKHNLNFLSSIAKDNSIFWDWKVTVAFYTSVHLINAHLACSENKHYRSHQDVSNSINPFIPGPSALPQDIFTSYEKLSHLSRRSRYLISEKKSNYTVDAQLTYDKHFAKALNNLAKIEHWFSNKYSVDFPNIKVYCIELQGNNYFKHEIPVSETF